MPFHLEELANAGLVTVARASRHQIYRAAFEHINEALEYLTDNCCEGATCAVETSATNCDC